MEESKIITKRNKRYFNIAKEIAECSDFKKNKRIGCIAVYNNIVISSGCNTEKTHPMQKSYNKYRNFEIGNDYTLPKMHAEIRCLSHIYDNKDIKWSKVTLYIYRSCRDRDHGLVRPCSACMNLIKDLGIKHIYYTTDIGYAYEVID